MTQTEAVIIVLNVVLVVMFAFTRDTSLFDFGVPAAMALAILVAVASLRASLNLRIIAGVLGTVALWLPIYLLQGQVVRDDSQAVLISTTLGAVVLLASVFLPTQVAK